MDRQRRYRVMIIEEKEMLPAVYRRPRLRFRHVAPRRSHPLEALVDAFVLLGRRGGGQRPWAPALSTNPLSFLLDAVTDPVILRRQNGPMVYRNRAAESLDLQLREPVALEELQLGEQWYQRRCMMFDHLGSTFVVEVFQATSDRRG